MDMFGSIEIVFQENFIDLIRSQQKRSSKITLTGIEHLVSDFCSNEFRNCLKKVVVNEIDLKLKWYSKHVIQSLYTLIETGLLIIWLADYWIKSPTRKISSPLRGSVITLLGADAFHDFLEVDFGLPVPVVVNDENSRKYFILKFFSAEIMEKPYKHIHFAAETPGTKTFHVMVYLQKDSVLRMNKELSCLIRRYLSWGLLQVWFNLNSRQASTFGHCVVKEGNTFDKRDFMLDDNYYIVFHEKLESKGFKRYPFTTMMGNFESQLMIYLWKCYMSQGGTAYENFPNILESVSYLNSDHELKSDPPPANNFVPLDTENILGPVGESLEQCFTAVTVNGCPYDVRKDPDWSRKCFENAVATTENNDDVGEFLKRVYIKLLLNFTTQTARVIMKAYVVESIKQASHKIVESHDEESSATATFPMQQALESTHKTTDSAHLMYLPNPSTSLQADNLSGLHSLPISLSSLAGESLATQDFSSIVNDVSMPMMADITISKDTKRVSPLDSAPIQRGACSYSHTSNFKQTKVRPPLKLNDTPGEVSQSFEVIKLSKPSRKEIPKIPETASKVVATSKISEEASSRVKQNAVPIRSTCSDNVPPSSNQLSAKCIDGKKRAAMIKKVKQNEGQTIKKVVLSTNEQVPILEKCIRIRADSTKNINNPEQAVDEIINESCEEELYILNTISGKIAKNKITKNKAQLNVDKIKNAKTLSTCEYQLPISLINKFSGQTAKSKKTKNKTQIKVNRINLNENPLNLSEELSIFENCSKIQASVATNKIQEDFNEISSLDSTNKKEELPTRKRSNCQTKGSKVAMNKKNKVVKEVCQLMLSTSDEAPALEILKPSNNTAKNKKAKENDPVKSAEETVPLGKKLGIEYTEAVNKKDIQSKRRKTKRSNNNSADSSLQNNNDEGNSKKKKTKNGKKDSGENSFADVASNVSQCLLNIPLEWCITPTESVATGAGENSLEITGIAQVNNYCDVVLTKSNEDGNDLNKLISETQLPHSNHDTNNCDNVPSKSKNDGDDLNKSINNTEVLVAVCDSNNCNDVSSTSNDNDDDLNKSIINKTEISRNHNNSDHVPSKANSEEHNTCNNADLNSLNSETAVSHGNREVYDKKYNNAETETNKTEQPFSHNRGEITNNGEDDIVEIIDVKIVQTVWKRQVNVPMVDKACQTDIFIINIDDD